MPTAIPQPASQEQELKRRRDQAKRQQFTNEENEQSLVDASRYDIDWGGEGEDTNKNLIARREPERQKKSSNGLGKRIAKTGSGQALSAAGQGAEKIGGAIGQAGGQIAGAAVGGAIGAASGAIAGGITGAMAGGVGAIPGAIAGAAKGASAGAKTGQNIGGKAGQTAGRAPGKTLQAAGTKLQQNSHQLLPSTRSKLGSLPLAGQPKLPNLNRQLTGGNASVSPMETASIAAKQYSAGILTGLWAAVWFDWTTLTVWFLDIYLLMAIIFQGKIADFGEDYLFGRWLPNKELAKYTEIMILGVINVLIVSVIMLLGYAGYIVASHPWKTAWGILLHGDPLHYQ